MVEMTIKDYTDLTPEFKGEEKEIEYYLSTVGRLWTAVDALQDEDKKRFLLQ